MENEIETIDSTNDTDTVETVETTDTDTTTVDVQKLQETNKKLFERAKRAEELARSLRGKSLPTPKAEVDDEIVSDVKELKLIEKKRQFGYKNSLSPEETDRLFRYAGGGDPGEALKDPFFQAGLKEFRREARVKDAIPSSGNRSSKVDGKSFAEMSPEERQKNWNKFIKK